MSEILPRCTTQSDSYNSPTVLLCSIHLCLPLIHAFSITLPTALIKSKHAEEIVWFKPSVSHSINNLSYKLNINSGVLLYLGGLEFWDISSVLTSGLTSILTSGLTSVSTSILIGLYINCVTQFFHCLQRCETYPSGWRFISAFI